MGTQLKNLYRASKKRVSQKSNIPGEQSPCLSEYALERMQQRGISHEAVFQTIAFGRISRGRGATIYAIGKKGFPNLRKTESIFLVMREHMSS